jgi:uncharacterized protein YlxW (UPF0749 family)
MIQGAGSHRAGSESKAMLDELQKLRSLNKNRDQLLTEIETKSKQLRESETEAKLLKNDLENAKHNLASAEKKNHEM